MLKHETKRVSVIVRTKNEEFWIERFLQSLASQVTEFDVELVIIDNYSNDETMHRAVSLWRNIIHGNIENYIPGAALNKGVELATGDFIVCISAHCIPVDGSWLNNLLLPLENDADLCCVYGRQIPLKNSAAQDKRDLWLTFGLDSKMQTKDPFIHNANAAYRKADLVAYPFSEEMTNIEDRGWAANQLLMNRKIFYHADATVYHPHGIHQTGNSERLDGVVSMMENLSSEFGKPEHYYGPHLLTCEPSKLLIVPISDRYENDDVRHLKEKAQDLRENFKPWEIFIYPSSRSLIPIIEKLGFEYLPYRLDRGEVTSRLILDISYAVQQLTNEARYYDYVASFDIRKPVPSEQFVDTLLSKMGRTGVKCGIATVETEISISQSISGQEYYHDTKGWKNWMKLAPEKLVYTLSPSNFIVAQMAVLRNENTLNYEFCTEPAN